MHDVKKFRVVVIAAAIFCIIVVIRFRLNQGQYGTAEEEGFFTTLFSQYRGESAPTSTNEFQAPWMSLSEQAEELRKLLVEYGIATLTSTSAPALLQATSTEANMRGATTSFE